MPWRAFQVCALWRASSASARERLSIQSGREQGFDETTMPRTGLLTVHSMVLPLRAASNTTPAPVARSIEMPTAALSRLNRPPSRLIWTLSPRASWSLVASTLKNESVSAASALIEAESRSMSRSPADGSAGEGIGAAEPVGVSPPRSSGSISFPTAMSSWLSEPYRGCRARRHTTVVNKNLVPRRLKSAQATVPGRRDPPLVDLHIYPYPLGEEPGIRDPASARELVDLSTSA